MTENAPSLQQGFQSFPSRIALLQGCRKSEKCHKRCLETKRDAFSLRGENTSLFVARALP
ncbi:hypothetical protein B5F76_12320 [Desulfovibrio sp. An276]|nr:hypothetical protein B5F76_12320 [Desulfovibrio sp. An276]